MTYFLYFDKAWVHHGIGTGVSRGMSLMTRSWPVLTIAIALFFMLSAPALAETAADDSIRLTPDASRTVRLEQDAASVIVTNPETARVILDTPRLLIVLPRQPGSTRFSALNAKGETIVEKNIIVAGTAKPHYVRIRRMCGQANTGSDCAPVSYYYCPDGCYEVSPVRPGDTAVPAQTGAGGISPAEFSSQPPAPAPDGAPPPPEPQ